MFGRAHGGAAPATSPPEWYAGQASTIPDTFVTHNGAEYQWFQNGALIHAKSSTAFSAFAPLKVYPNGSTLVLDVNTGTSVINSRLDVRANGITAGLSVQAGTVFLGHLTGPIQPTLVGIPNFASPTIAGTATSGSSGAPPTTVQGYISITINGTPHRIPYYNP